MSVVGEHLLLAIALHGGNFRGLDHGVQIEWMEIAAELLDAHRPSELVPDDAEVVDAGVGSDEAGARDEPLELPYGPDASSST